MDKNHNNSVFLSKNDKKSALFNHRLHRFLTADCADYYGLQAAEDPSEITLRYLTGQAKIVFDGKCGVG